MARPDAVARHYVDQQRQAQTTVVVARQRWADVTVADLEASWARQVGRLVAVVAAAQLGAAKAGAGYIPAALTVDVPVDAQVRPAAWSGIASDGRPLDTLLYAAVVHVKESLGAGFPPAAALAAGRSELETLIRTQVADAGRGAAGAAITTRPGVGWIRMVNPPCCQRCAVLAGRFFRWNDGFDRHPRCDCRHTPTTEAGVDDVAEQVPVDQIKDLTAAQRQAIADGADPVQVINAHRAGRRSKSGMTTSEGTRHGTYRRRGRLTPEGIYRLSASREGAVEMLRRYGYLW